MGASRRSIEGSSHRHPSRYCTALARSRAALRAERGLFELLVHVVALAPSRFSRPCARRAEGGAAQLGALGSRAGAHRVPQGHPRRVVCCRAPLGVCRPCRFAQPEAGGQRPRGVERYLLFRRPRPAAHRPHDCAPGRCREARKATRRTDPRRLSGCGREACGLRWLHGCRAGVRARRVPRRGAAKPRFAHHAEDSPANAGMTGLSRACGADSQPPSRIRTAGTRARRSREAYGPRARGESAWAGAGRR
jgi:hypothetical protein